MGWGEVRRQVHGQSDGPRHLREEGKTKRTEAFGSVTFSGLICWIPTKESCSTPSDFVKVGHSRNPGTPGVDINDYSRVILSLLNLDSWRKSKEGWECGQLQRIWPRMPAWCVFGGICLFCACFLEFCAKQQTRMEKKVESGTNGQWLFWVVWCVFWTKR